MDMEYESTSKLSLPSYDYLASQQSSFPGLFF